MKKKISKKNFIKRDMPSKFSLLDTMKQRQRSGLCCWNSDICVREFKCVPHGSPCEHFGRSYPHTMHLIASNRSVRIYTNPAIVDGAPSRRIMLGRICRISFPSPQIIGYLCEGSSIFTTL